MTDQDVDGSHIKGLCINAFDAQWSDITKIEDFLGFMNTPILKAKKGRVEKVFYNEADYLQWKESIGDAKGCISNTTKDWERAHPRNSRNTSPPRSM